MYFTRNSALWRIRATGGQPELVAEPRPGEGIPALIRSHVLPGSKVLLFEIGLVTFSGVGVLSLQTGEILRISVDGSDPFYSATGHILFPRRNTLFAVPFDAERFEVTGLEHRDRHAHAVVGKDAGHSQFLRNHSGPHGAAPRA